MNQGSSMEVCKCLTGEDSVLVKTVNYQINNLI